MSSGDGVPDFEGARTHLFNEVVRFTRRLRQNDVQMPANASLEAARTLLVMGLDDEEQVRDALRATLLSTDRDDDDFEAQFPEFWARLRAGLQQLATPNRYVDPDDDQASEGTVSIDEMTISQEFEEPDELDTESIAGVDSDAESDPDPEMDPDVESSVYSPQASRQRADLDDRIEPSGFRTLDRFERVLATLSGRRERSSSAGDRTDVRQTLRTNLETGGIAFEVPRRERRDTELRACVLVDVSQSVLDTIDVEFVLAFLDRFQERNRSVRTFLFDTDIREVSEVFGNSKTTPREAVRTAGIEWGGGTRIGHAFDELLTTWPYAVDSRTMLLVISDGLDVGDVDRLESAMATLSRRTAGTLWLNPLATSPDYEPVCRGMAAALPHVDGLFAFTGIEDLGEITRQLEQQGLYGRIGYQYDSRRHERSGDDMSVPAGHDPGVELG
jgi:uncharacterized protein with von Willebrand factor type A (vWA) domain